MPVYGLAQSVVPAFTIPDTVCLNTPVTITNTSTGASSYFWNFCVADVNAQPTAVNLGNPGNYLSQPVFVDLVADNGSYYGFVVNYIPGGLTRLDFGNSLLNTPTPVFLGNISGVMNTGYGSEGIQIVKTNGKWYGVVVGGSPSSGTGAVPKLITVYFGTNITNPSPTAVNWGNLGNMLQCIDLHIFQESGIWYGFTTNSENNTITRFNFTSSFDNPPTAVNLGNIGGLNYPTGVFAVNDAGAWRVFVTNAGNSTLTRLDFGNSLLNTPTGANLGNPGNALNLPRDITIFNLCGQSVGFAVNQSNTICRLNFSTLLSTPSASSLGNIGNLNFPHSLSKLFRVENDIYSLITNVNNNTITRLKFSGCSSSSLPSSNLQNPLPVTYNTPGVYNINLTVNDGLPTQGAVCKQIVVVAPPVHSLTKSFSLCSGTSLKIGSSIHPAQYSWSTGSVTDSIIINKPGTYWVESARYGCSVRDSFVVSSPTGTADNCDSIRITGANSVCSPGDTVTYTIYRSSNCMQQYALQTDSVFASVVTQTSTTARVVFRQNGTTSLKVSFTSSCRIIADSIAVNVRFSPTAINLGTDITACRDTALLLHAGSGFAAYLWQDGSSDSTLLVKVPGTYNVVVQNSCNAQLRDTLLFTRKLSVPFTASPSIAAACKSDSVQFTATGGTSYTWQPAASFSNPAALAPKAVINASQNFTLSITDAVCARDTVITIPVTTLPGAQIVISKSNDVTCSNDSAVLTATGGTTYLWSPDAYITNRGNNKITVKPPGAATYYVRGSNATGCAGQDSVKVDFFKEGDQKLFTPTAFTPNGDGRNDVFHGIFIGPATRYSMVVYNRWGQLLFRTDNPQTGWDGTYNRVAQPGGVYVYYVRAEGGCTGNKFEQKGTVILIR